MKVQPKHGPGGRYVLVATLGDYDGFPPTDAFIVDHQPRVINPERLGMACYLAFGSWCGGELHLPVKVGPATANAMVRDAAPSGISLHPNPIEYYPKPLPIGTRELKLTRELAVVNAATIQDLQIDQWSGSLRSHSSVIVPSNSFLFDSTSGGIRAHLAVAMLFANDAQADLVVVENEVEECEKERLTELFGAVRLGIRFA